MDGVRQASKAANQQRATRAVVRGPGEEGGEGRGGGGGEGRLAKRSQRLTASVDSLLTAQWLWPYMYVLVAARETRPEATTQMGCRLRGLELDQRYSYGMVWAGMGWYGLVWAGMGWSWWSGLVGQVWYLWSGT